MTAATPLLVLRCPYCGSGRPLQEAFCENVVDGAPCGYVLVGIDPTQPDAAPPPPTHFPKCRNGHAMEPGDEICLICGGDSAGFEEPPQPPLVFDPPASPAVIGGWTIDRPIPPTRHDQPCDLYRARHTDGRDAFVALYRTGAEPDPAVQALLKRLPLEHVPEFFEAGRHDGRAWEATEWINGGALADLDSTSLREPDRLRHIVAELVEVLASFAEVGLRHRDINPDTILVRTPDPLDLVVTGFGSARLSDFDLDSVAPLELTRYSAPEAIVGAVSAASDWWSLGMIVLELITSGSCFEGVNDQAFRLHVVTRGISLPSGLDPDIRMLLRGLLARDPLQRWTAGEVRDWLAGRPVNAPPEGQGADNSGPSLVVGGRPVFQPDAFALAAAEAANWDEARDLVLRGNLAHWLQTRQADPKMLALVRRIAMDEAVGPDWRLALALMAVSPDLPLTMRGDIITPAWLLQNGRDGHDLVMGGVVAHLERMQREQWLVRLRSRAELVRSRAVLLEIELDEERFRIAALASSRANLEAERDAIRQVFPDTEHTGLASLVERGRLTDEDLVLLVSAALHQYVPLATLTDEAANLAGRAGIDLDPAAAAALFMCTRRDIFARIEERIANFSRCGHARVDEWADMFRVERRLPLPRAAVLLAIPADQWKEPPKQQYITTLLSHFERRVSGSISRGPLARFTIGKTTPRLDLAELGTRATPAEALVNHVIARTELAIPLDPSAYLADELRFARLRRLVSHATNFRRDTGLDGRVMGFPFVVVRDGKQGDTGGREPRPRIAPVLLWPVAIDLQPGAGSIATLAFDRDREEVRLNPALEGILGADTFRLWGKARDTLLGHETLSVRDVIDAFADLADRQGDTMSSLPSKDIEVPPHTRTLWRAAALFNAEFTGQSVAEDLRQMGKMPLADTGLQSTLRISGEVPELAPMPNVSESDRYGVVNCDPSQDGAVLRARQAPGLLVEGPPGTGKSQTIVNVIADAIGRGETVLVVCQKLAALKVVQKRLDAEGLGERLFLVGDVIRDREPVIRALRAQLEALKQTQGDRLADRVRARRQKAARIEALEREIDLHHQALHARDTETGSSYRELLGDLIRLESSGPPVDLPQLRQRLGRLDPERLTALEDQCAGLARLWLDAAFEDSPLAALKPFPADASIGRAVQAALADFVSAEAERQKVLAETGGEFDIDDPAPYRAWLSGGGVVLASLPETARRDLAAWFALFRRGADSSSPGADMLKRLEGAASDLRRHPAAAFEQSLVEAISGLDHGVLIRCLDDARAATRPASLLGRLNPLRWIAARRARHLARMMVGRSAPPGLDVLRDALASETHLRHIRQTLADSQTALGLPLASQPLPADRLGTATDALLGRLHPVREATAAALSLPDEREATAFLSVATREAEALLRRRIDAAMQRHGARTASLAALSGLGEWFSGDWTTTIARRIAGNEPTIDLFRAIIRALPTLEPYQRFRMRVADADPDVLATFRALRAHESLLRQATPSTLPTQVGHAIRREALLARKGQAETARPELLAEREELERKIAELARLDTDLRALNRELLSQDIDRSKLGTATAWEDITRLRGPRARRLREILDQGADIGLMRLRPVWLMNPDIASRMLPLKAGLFDLVIYDEASQMPVEHAVPTLFRSKRILVAGDEKQMPPSGFFSSAIDGSDDDEDGLDPDNFEEAATEAERSRQEESWNRREVKDCPDLLQLSRSVLPSTTLQIHYRSQYRELIGYSNHAFYRGELSVPARHPDGELRRVRPIKVLRVDGVYENQTNPSEAEAVVDWVAELWATNPAPPSVGVVTFNRKQADLIEDILISRTGTDPDFLRSYQRENNRVQNGEDMRFFVKNVENVQGDERDVIVFSTTFGRDRRGAFRRNFGVLGQSGGERRLNVAVTRARSEIVLVTSMPVNDVSDWLASGRAPSKPRDYLQAYLHYASCLSAGDLQNARGSLTRMEVQAPLSRHDAAAADGLVADVAAYVRDLGFHPVPAAGGDAFGLDFAIEDPRSGQFGLGIECDAHRHPLLERARAREIWRPGVLKRAIPAIHRISSHAWYHRPAEERQRLKEAIQSTLN